MQVKRPVPVSARNRVVSITPMPQVHRSNILPRTYSPPPFDHHANQPKANQIEDIFGSFKASHQANNIPLLARGISLLSITQLRELLRDYSLPTGGNKHILVNRLIIFLETFGQNQHNLLIQFSAKLKKLLSVESEEPQQVGLPEEPVQVHQLPPDVKQFVNDYSPSCLFEVSTDLSNPFGPIIVQGNSLQTPYVISLSAPPVSSVPILQFIPFYRQDEIHRVVFQLDDIVISLQSRTPWHDMSNFINRKETIKIISVEPMMPMVAIVKWMRRVSIPHLIRQIINEREVTPEFAQATLINAQPPNGICPLTRKIITHPARGINCTHAECFDLSGFLCSAIRTNNWQCPICRKIMTAEDLRIDTNFLGIVSPMNR
ncbi:MIZ zinc finger family protein [Histomonas meleagridis]|uniref:MIZ zinc finger family protein n=1 Tax=Histomonas meleagridis TaxID=135588 RepID=UPI00355AAD49|nr:MIZ zinc finger family protein [Histomonas meleagridis]KAH0800609.1 MIZ zinc finger family protein [Histomonas meleagridis]